MSEIKRYKVGSYRMAEHGDMVFYDDHIAELDHLQARCAELERERIEVARKAFLAGANWQAGGLAFNQPVINREANQYIEQLKEKG